MSAQRISVGKNLHMCCSRKWMNDLFCYFQLNVNLEFNNKHVKMIDSQQLDQIKARWKRLCSVLEGW